MPMVVRLNRARGHLRRPLDRPVGATGGLAFATLPILIPTPCLLLLRANVSARLRSQRYDTL
jgi:hypothetical protein